MSYTEILYDVEDHVARLTLNRPEKRNPLGSTTVSELCHALERARDDADVRCVVLTGAGVTFCAGGDLSELNADGSRQPRAGEVPPRTFLHLNLAFTRLGKPAIAKVNGPAVGGGLGLVVACDLALAADTATFATPEITIGLWPMMIMANIVRNVGRKQGLRLLLTGDKVSAAEAARMGLINEVVPAAELEARTTELARHLAAKSPTAMRLGLDAFYATQDMALEPALDYLEGQFATLAGTEDAREGIRAFLEKRPPLFRGR